jgi:hypothetical protein
METYFSIMKSHFKREEDDEEKLSYQLNHKKAFRSLQNKSCNLKWKSRMVQLGGQMKKKFSGAISEILC